ANQKAYHAGDKVGDFKLVAFDTDRIELEWNGKKVERKPDELAPKETVAAAAVSTAAAPVGAAAAAANVSHSAVNYRPEMGNPDAAAAAPAVTSLGATTAEAAKAEPPAGIGDEISGGVRQCLPGDNSPAGTVLNGYQKRMISSMFGSVCRW